MGKAPLQIPVSTVLLIHHGAVTLALSPLLQRLLDVILCLSAVRSNPLDILSSSQNTPSRGLKLISTFIAHLPISDKNVGISTSFKRSGALRRCSFKVDMLI